MKFEKFYNSIIFRIFEILYKFIIFNLLFILTFILGLGIFGYMTALVILVLGIKSIGEGTEFMIVKTWIINVKKYFVQTLKLSVFYTIIISLAVFDTIYFYLLLQNNANLFYEICFYLFLIIDLFIVFMTINAAFVFVYFPNLNNKKIIKYSAKLIMLVPFQAIVLIITFILGIVMLYVFPLLLVFIWFSGSLYLYHLLIRKKYQKLVIEGVKPLTMSDY